MPCHFFSRIIKQNNISDNQNPVTYLYHNTLNPIEFSPTNTNSWGVTLFALCSKAALFFITQAGAQAALDESQASLISHLQDPTPFIWSLQAHASTFVISPIARCIINTQTHEEDRHAASAQCLFYLLILSAVTLFLHLEEPQMEHKQPLASQENRISYFSCFAATTVVTNALFKKICLRIKDQGVDNGDYAVGLMNGNP